MELLHILPAIPPALQGYLIIAAVLLYLGRLIKTERGNRVDASLTKQGKRIGGVEQAIRVERIARLQQQATTNRLIDAVRAAGIDVPPPVQLAEVLADDRGPEHTSTEIPPLPANFRPGRHTTREDTPA